VAPVGPLARVLDRLHRVRRSGRGFVAACPSHDDRHPSLSVTEANDGKVLLRCFSGGCAFEQIVAALGLEPRDLFPAGSRGGRGEGGNSPRKPIEHSNGPRVGLTVQHYAAAKRLPADFLASVGVSECSYLGAHAVRMEYRDESGAVRAARFRLALEKAEDGDHRFVWRKGNKAMPYGLWRLEAARKGGSVALVEGESDCQTLWFHRLPALGIPGAKTWREDWAHYLDGFSPIYVVDEGDSGGRSVHAWLSRSAIRDRVYLVRLPNHLNDPSGLYLDDPERFLERWQLALDHAIPWPELEAFERDRDATDARSAAEELLTAPDLLDQIGAVMRARGYAGDLSPPLLAYVAMTSRLLERPQNIAFVAQSSAGKNRAVDAAVELMPPHSVFIVSASSSRALIYTEETFSQRVVVVGEADSIPEEGPAASAVRSLAADNQMVYEVTEKDERTGKHRTRRIEKPGPTAFITTSTHPLGQQMGTRMLEVPIRDDPDQTREVILAHARNVMRPRDTDVDLSPYLALQRWLELAGERRAYVPFAEALASLLPSRAVRMRRDSRQLFACVQAVALLHQEQRERAEDGSVLASLDDYAAVRLLLAPTFDMVAADGLTPAVRQTVEAVNPDEELTEADLARRLRLARSSVSYRVGRALAGGWLLNKASGKNQRPRLARGAPLPEESSALPTVGQVRAAFECSIGSPQGTPPSPPLHSRVEAGAPESDDNEDVEWVA
jgi:hypothetical protein